jgi:hypothetical protein
VIGIHRGVKDTCFAFGKQGLGLFRLRIAD